MTKINYKSYKICLIILLISFLIFVVKREETISISVGGEAIITTFAPIKINTVENKEIIELSEVNSNTVKIVGNNTGTANVNLSLGGIQIKDVNINVTDDVYLIPGGETLGIRINTKGVLVLGTGYVNGVDTKVYRPVENIIRAGDIINKVNDVDVETKEQFVELIQSEEEINIQITRDGKEKDVLVTPIKAVEDNKYKVGLWVRDSTQGIGTLTYYNPKTLEFVSLGHGITDVDTKSLMTVKNGSAFLSDIISVNKGEKGSPGELVGEIKIKNEIGKVINNKENGVHGVLTNVENLDNRLYGAIPICKMENIKVGEATILSNINGTDVVEYNIYIDSINKGNKESKNMVIKVTDTRLLEDTNGIVQGMSGSPIIQNGKLVGAVTHVFVQDPTKGYGIFIENMMK